MIDDIEKRSLPEELKQEAVEKLRNIQAERAKQEVDHLINHLPLHLDRKQLAAYLDKINQYQGVDITPYRQQLGQRKDMAEKEEITAMIKRGGKKNGTPYGTCMSKYKEKISKKKTKLLFWKKYMQKSKKWTKNESNNSVRAS